MITKALLIALALVGAWGGWQRWKAIGAVNTLTAARLEAEAANAKQAAADATEHARRLKSQQEKIDAANLEAQRRKAEATAARATVGKLRDHTAALEADLRSTDPSTAADCETARATGGMLAGMLDRLAARAATYAEYAEAAAAAGEACQSIYQDLTERNHEKDH